MDSDALHDQTPATEETWASRSSYAYLGHATHVSEPCRDAPLYLVLLVCSDALHDRMPATEEAWATGSSRACLDCAPILPNLALLYPWEGISLWLSVFDLALGDRDD